MPPEHPIRLERVLFTRSVVIALSGHKGNDFVKLTNGPVNELGVRALDDKPGHYCATMRTRINEAGDPVDPYTIDMECLGFFVVNDTLIGDEAVRAVTITGHSVLYGAIREAVSWLTGRQPYGEIGLGLSVLATKPPEEPEPAP